jgi:hypothetical protein
LPWTFPDCRFLELWAGLHERRLRKYEVMEADDVALLVKSLK